MYKLIWVKGKRSAIIATFDKLEEAKYAVSYLKLFFPEHIYKLLKKMFLGQMK